MKVILPKEKTKGKKKVIKANSNASFEIHTRNQDILIGTTGR
jgi:hypothetical protein